MHCISDSSAANCSRCSLHWPGALSAHTVRMSSIIVHPFQAEPHRVDCGILSGTPQLRGLIDLATPTLSRPDTALGKTCKVSQSCDEFGCAMSGEEIEDEEARLKGVQVTTAARLRLGFLDLAGDLGRRFGSIGLAIDAFETRVGLYEARSFEVLGAERDRGADIARRVAESLGLDMGGKLIISNAIP